MALRDIQAASKKKIQPEIEAFLTDIFGKMKALINQEIKLAGLKIHSGSNDDFFNEFKRKRFLMTRMDWEAKGGLLALLNSVEIAIAMAGYMWTLPSSTVETKIKARDFDDELQDVYKEVSNQLYGSVNQYITGKRDPEAQIKFTMEDLPMNGKKNNLINDGDYLLLLIDAQVGDQQPFPMYFLITEKILPDLFDCGEGFSLAGQAFDESTGLIEGSLDKTPAERIMITDYPSIDVEKTIGDAYDLMDEKGVDVLPIVEDEGKVLRVLTKNNIEIMKSVFFDAPGMEERRSRIMCIPLSVVNRNQELIFARPNDSLTKVLRTMIKHQFQALPILEADKEFLGMITVFQVLDLLTPQLKEHAAAPMQADKPADSDAAAPAEAEKEAVKQE